jgi:hypothetical protein
MKINPILIVAGFFAATSCQAGALANGTWSPVNCGVKPAKPQLSGKTVEVFNKGVAAINSWQKESHKYLECLIKEANTDNTIIADSANKVQKDFREEVEAMAAEAEALKKKLDAK